ncbi:alpha/beta hydrolase [Tenacibaculum bernardetii]|uniref:alpha/beta hydrolase n=1 Tax=Tenacibaculum bernardetii TaxID=3021375 RepID=UPI0023B1D7B6|nr:alpha/beta hydrolase [Tenacibaculum bernardetii]
MTKKILKYLGVLLVLFLMLYAIGPKAEKPTLTTQLPINKMSLLEIQNAVYVENDNASIRLGNHSRLIWADSIPKKTEYSLVYLHGFSASPAETEIIYTNFAKRYGANLYAPRLFKHGLKDKEPLLNFTAEGYLESAKKAIAIGKQLGEKVILICVSTGATAGLFLASENPEIAALILSSPNIDVYDTNSNLVTKPWGKQILKLVMGGNYQTWQPPNGAEKYWYAKYRIEAIVQLKLLIGATMKQNVFEKIKQPLFMAYYYKNEEEQDKTVSVKRMKEMYNQISTTDKNKYQVAIPEAKNHSIASKFFTEEYKTVEKEIYYFADTVLKLKTK